MSQSITNASLSDFTDTIQISNQTGTRVQLHTANAYLKKDIELNLNVQSGSATTPATNITANPTVSNSNGIISATVNTSQNITPTVNAGWVGSGVAGTVSVGGTSSVAATSLDANLAAENIKNGVSIFGIEGTADFELTLEQNNNGELIIPAIAAADTSVKIPLEVSDDGQYTPNSGYSYNYVNVATKNEVSENDVMFFDYDGTLIYSYSASDFAQLTEFPKNPTHTGLIAQGWNWTLLGAKNYVAKYGKLFIGQSYITDDNKTRIYISLSESRLSPYLGIAVNGTISVNWGDGSATETVTGTSTTTSTNVQHTYATAGDYVISVDVITGSMAIIGDNSCGSHLLWKTVTNGTLTKQNNIYTNSVRKLEIGANCTIGTYAMSKCYSLETVTIPTNVSLFANYAFQNCVSLKFVVVPYGILLLQKFLFNYCYRLSRISLCETINRINESCFSTCQGLRALAIPNRVTAMDQDSCQGLNALAMLILPDSLTTVSNYAFTGCWSISKLTIPENVTNIGNYALQNCCGLKELHFKPASPPTLGGVNSFLNLPTDCVIYVPTDKLEDYTSAQNYPSSETYTYIEE